MKLVNRTCSRPFARAALFAAALLLSGAVSRADAAPAYADWFRYGADAARAWTVSEVPGNPLEVSITRSGEQTGPLRRVLVLYPRASSAYDIAITQILKLFDRKGVNAEITVKNFKIDDVAGNAALDWAAKHNVDLIFSMGSESTAWLYDNYRNGTIPVVSVCSKDPVTLGQMRSYNYGSGTNFAFTSLNMPIEVQMNYVLELLPNLKNIAVLVDSKNIGAVQTQSEPIMKFARQRGIQVLEVAVQNPKRAKDELAVLVPNAVASMRKSDPTLSNSLFWVTGSTSVFEEINMINANADRVPVLSVVPEVVKAGDDSAVMSIGISFESNAHLAAIYGADVLSGRSKVGDLKVGIVSPPDIAINFRKAREIALSVPFSFFESATYIYDYDGRPVRTGGQSVTIQN